MNAKRLMMALLAALLISALFTFWLSRRLARVASCCGSTEATYGGSEPDARSG